MQETDLKVGHYKGEERLAKMRGELTAIGGSPYIQRLNFVRESAHSADAMPIRRGRSVNEAA